MLNLTRSTIPLLILLAAAQLPAEDVVILANPQKGSPPQERKGVIEEYTGEELTLVTAGDRKTQIPAERVLEVRSTWTRSELAGDDFRRQGKLAEALEAYRSALREERRSWAVRKIQAKLVACYEWNDQPELAGEEFLAIVAQDPQTLYFSAIPLAWRNATPNAALLERARKWMAEKSNPAATLLGASWLLAGDERQRATNLLQSLSSDLDPRIALLAVTQLWRPKIVTVTTDDIPRWQTVIARIPPDLQGGPQLLLGQALQRLKQPEDAKLAYLQAALAPNQRELLAIDGYLAAATLLEQQSRANDAARLFREIQAMNPIAAKFHKIPERLVALEKASAAGK